ncbi:fumarylacetoacetate hydrolase family protein [Chelativorans sp. M5D2P16]|uniref:fumarylacetoacetate hydrolase family protein n=1 Tax=Chelativorans sp. M5D2P16 TaxID=3095678 RepID=UPI002ACB02E2|nr:fumarylacetoacetate hydrolase family protein [Chelativorans sp. M5D2P16]MDZ5698763.1 fumarylacetoacetate hydrolase family protein [Chelativorans sp. M5D2P16]
MTKWVHFEDGGRQGFGILDGDEIVLHTGNLFDNPQPTDQRRPLSAVRLLAPCQPSKIIALWNNFSALAAKLGVAEPEEPLYLLKAVSSIAAPGATIRRPPSYTERVVYEGELGIVIGRTCSNASESEAAAAVFGYTCVNDVTASDIISRDSTFAQWARAKSFDGFGPFGPVIATDIDPASLAVRTELNGVERQNYPLSNMIFPVPRLVSALSKDMTLLPGDLICCGTSIGVGSMKEPSNEVSVSIEGIGTLSNTFVQ